MQVTDLHKNHQFTVKQTKKMGFATLHFMKDITLKFVSTTELDDAALWNKLANCPNLQNIHLVPIWSTNHQEVLESERINKNSLARRIFQYSFRRTLAKDADILATVIVHPSRHMPIVRNFLRAVLEGNKLHSTKSTRNLARDLEWLQNQDLVNMPLAMPYFFSKFTAELDLEFEAEKAGNQDHNLDFLDYTSTLRTHRKTIWFNLHRPNCHCTIKLGDTNDLKIGTTYNNIRKFKNVPEIHDIAFPLLVLLNAMTTKHCLTWKGKHTPSFNVNFVKI